MNVKQFLKEYVVFFYRLLLVFFFYSIARGLFLWFNMPLLGEYPKEDNYKMFLYGLKFDTTAILYVNMIFILLSILPIRYNIGEKFEKILLWAYFLPNTLAYATNFIDIAYYPFSRTRLTTASFDVIKNEQNKLSLFFAFMGEFWYLIVLFAALLLLWIYLYKKFTRKTAPLSLRKWKYFAVSSLLFIPLGLLIVMGLRGGALAANVRPINMLHANQYTTIPEQASVILNTPFCLIRSIGKNKGFEEKQWVSQEEIKRYIKPIKQYNRVVKNKPNVLIFILESFGREYWGCMNKQRDIAGFRSYTPFLDSLSNHSAYFSNAYNTGRQSIHAISSILAGVPSFTMAHTYSPYANQKTQSIVSIANEMEYITSFFHSAHNGSMGFDSFCNILGVKSYYGKNEYDQIYGKDAHYDGMWGVWDEEFFLYMNQKLSDEKQPFLSTIFTVSSHHPFKIPAKYENTFDKGTLEIHKSIQYTDHALKVFFEQAKQQPWYDNTIFVFVNDHGNQNYYPYYAQPISSAGAAILFYSPNKKLVPTGKYNGICQQIDIYPSLVDLMGYQKPFRSWGKSLFTNLPDEPQRAFISNANVYQMMQGNYTYIMNQDGSINGIYRKEDEALKENIYQKDNSIEIKNGIQTLKAFIQDYIHTIVHRKLHPKE